MTTFRRICIEDYTVTAEDGETFTVRRGKEYTTSAERADGQVIVFSTYWVPVPVRLFAGAVPFTP